MKLRLFLLCNGLLFLTACGTKPVSPVGTVDQPAVKAAATKEDPIVAVVQEKQLMAAVDMQNSIFFPQAGVQIDAEGAKKLAGHAQKLKADPRLSVQLIGHTEDLGSPSYNLAIAEQRVNAVYAALRSQGVPLTQIRRYGVGREKVELACKSDACRRKMRRVELVFER